MTTATRRLLIGAIIGALVWRATHRKMEDSPDIPEFMKRRSHLCEEDGCVNRALPHMKKCLDCAFEEIMPHVWDDVEAITKHSKKAS